ncbi:MAG: hypothetical protein R2867_40710 [Caldilineaceae bacterium]
MVADPRETTNRIADQHYQPEVQRLAAQLNAFYAQYAEPARAGTQVTRLPLHNRFEPWRA